MRAAPAVSVDAHDGGLGRAAVAALVGLAAGTLLRWVLLWLAVPLEALGTWPGADLVLAVVGALLCGTWSWRRAGGGPVRLYWDGAVWHWQAAGAAPEAGRVHVVFDLGRWLLLAFDPDPPADTGRLSGWRGVWPLRRGAGRRWRVLDNVCARAARAALYAAAPIARATV